MPIQDYFSDDNIIRELCKARISFANRRHEALFFHKIDTSRPSAEKIPWPDSWREIPHDIFPPRKFWNKFRPKDRSNRARDFNLEALVRAAHHFLRETPHAEWAKKLRDTVLMIRQRALYELPFTFSSPAIVPEPKDKKSKTYRPLASLFLSDRIIDCLTARYFRETLNGAFLESCLAFRPKRDGRHDGLDTILKLHEKHIDGRLFAAECDIKGFYDCVSHTVARNALEELILDAYKLTPSLRIDPRAVDLFEAYLRCYSFLENVRHKAEPELRKRQRGAKYPWREEELRGFHGSSATLVDIGVPQGGSLSTLIANAVLHKADKALQAICLEQNVIYLRYCDDMIVLGPDRGACEAAFNTYRNICNQLRLPIHDAAPLKRYQGNEKSAFWGAKSKPVFCWADPRKTEAFPWIQFLGYQIRYDGVVRIRFSSIGKEMSKLSSFADKMLRSLRPSNVPHIRRSSAAIVHRFRMKLIAMAVGRRDVGQSLDEPLPKCWANGFRWLAGKNVITTNLKALDRQRERQLNRIIRRVKTLNIQSPKKPKERQDKKPRPYYGFPYSYRGQFILLPKNKVSGTTQ